MLKGHSVAVSTYSSYCRDDVIVCQYVLRQWVQ